MTRPVQQPNRPRRAAANNNTPPTHLTIERAIADNLPPEQLRMVASWHAGNRRSETIANNLLDIADRLLVLGYGERRVA
jgi:hypothetical protein